MQDLPPLRVQNRAAATTKTKEGGLMVAYSFKARFIPRIEDGSKRQTMRNERARHVRPTEEAQLYYAQRTKQCRLVGRSICTAVTPVRLGFGNQNYVKVESRPTLLKRSGLNEFAVRDGFSDWDDLCDFWAEEHPQIYDWSGVLIEWGDLLAS